MTRALKYELLLVLNFKRPLRIEFTNRFIYLDEKNFGPILRIVKRNTLYFQNNYFDCDCRMYWIMKDRKSFENRITSMDCKGHFFGHSLKLIFIIAIILNIQINKCKQ
jgi:hypothetical protein